MIQFISFACSCPVFPTPTIEEFVFSALYILASFVIDYLSIYVWVHFWALYSGPLIYVSIFVPLPSQRGFVYTLNKNIIFSLSLEGRKGECTSSYVSAEIHNSGGFHLWCNLLHAVGCSVWRDIINHYM